MGLVAPLSTGGVPKKSDSNDTLITANDIATAVKDTFVNRTAIAPETYPSIYGSLLQYTSGVPVIVEYYKKRAPYIGNQTIDVSFSLDRSSVHFSYDLIHDFEMRIEDQLEIKVDSETTETTLTGSAIVYPGINPNVGDVFLMKLPDSKIGLFQVNLTEPMSIYRGSYYKITFHLLYDLDPIVAEKLAAMVSEQLWFNKQSYFSGEAALLTSTSYNQLTSLVRYRKAIIARMMTKFYDNSEKTIIRPDGKFDIYLVEFLTNKISINDDRRSLCQLPNPYIDLFDRTIWKSFLTQDVSNILYTGYTLVQYQMYLFDVNMSNFDRYPIVTLLTPTKKLDGRQTQLKFVDSDTTFKSVSYFFSDRFYYTLLHSFENASVITDVVPLLGNMVNDKRMFPNLNTTFYSVSDNAYHDISFFDTLSKTTGSNNDLHIPEIEYLVFDFILNNNIDLTYLIEKVLVKFPFSTMTDLDQVYILPILLHLIDVGLTKIR